MKRQATNPSGLWQPGPHHFSQCVTVTDPSRLIYLAGQTAIDEHGQIQGEGDFAAQTRLCFRNIAAALADQGATLAAVTALTVFFVDLENLETYTTILREFIPADAPTQTVVEVRRLAMKELLIEIVATAAG
jgi:2-iminobutanoate/2-iminopropanoate deaminase